MAKDQFECSNCYKKYEEEDIDIEMLYSSPCCGSYIFRIWWQEEIDAMREADKLTPEDRKKYTDLLKDE